MNRLDLFTVCTLILTVAIVAVVGLLGSPELGYQAVAVGGLIVIMTFLLRRGDG